MIIKNAVCLHVFVSNDEVGIVKDKDQYRVAFGCIDGNTVDYGPLVSYEEARIDMWKDIKRVWNE